MEQDFLANFVARSTNASAYLIGVGLPLLILYLIKDFVANIASGILIKLKSNFHLHNNFSFDGRKNCRIKDAGLTEIVVYDVDTRQTLRIFNKDFVKLKIWENPFVKRGYVEEHKEKQ